MNASREWKNEATIPTLFYESGAILIAKDGMETIRNNKGQSVHEHKYKITNENICKLNPET